MMYSKVKKKFSIAIRPPPFMNTDTVVPYLISNYTIFSYSNFRFVRLLSLFRNKILQIHH